MSERNLRWLRALGGAMALVLGFEASVLACETCDGHLLTPLNQFCRATNNAEIGAQYCDTQVEMIGISCTLSGNFCEEVTVIGGGGGGGGGGLGY